MWERGGGTYNKSKLLFNWVTGRFVREEVSRETGGEGFVVLSEPLRREILRLRDPLEPQKAAGNSVRLPMQTPLRQFRPRAQALVFADRGSRSLRISCPHYSPPQRTLPLLSHSFKFIGTKLAVINRLGVYG